MEALTRSHPDPVSLDAPAAEESGRASEPESVFDRMQREGYRFDFYQAVRLLEQRRKPPGVPSQDALDDARLRFRPSPSLAFPASDVARLDVPEDPNGTATVTATFMGLYGVDAPLPEFFYDRIAVDETSATELRDFLDMFADRFYRFFYRAWKLVRPEVDAGRAHERRFLALAGLAHVREADAPVAPLAMVPFAGYLAPRARGAEGLAGLLSSLLDLPARIEQFVPRWVRIGRTPGLGRGARLGGDSMLGERIFDVAGKFRILLGPMDLDPYLSLLPGGAGANVLAWAVRAHVPGYLDYDVALELRTDHMPVARLSDNRCRLGLTACLGRPSVPIMTRIVHEE